MKKLFALALICFFVSALISCGTKKKGSCDAYGSKTTIENADLASK